MREHGWKVSKAEEFCLSVRDGTHDSPKFVEHGFPLVTSKHIRDGRLVLDSAGLISEEDFIEVNKRSEVHQWDVIFTMIGTIGEVYLVTDEQPMFAIKNVGLFKCGSEAKAKWLYYFLKSPATKRALLQLRRGASQQYIPLGALREIKIPHPQRESEMLSVVDRVVVLERLIDNNRRRIVLLEQSARLLYREWFVHLRFPGHEHIKVVDGVPEGWVPCSFHDVADVLSGGTPKTGVPEFWEGDIPFFTPKDARDVPYVLETEKYLTEAGLSKCNSQLFPRDMVFITARGTVGKVALVQVPMAMNQSCYALRGKDHISQLFLYCALIEAIGHFKSQSGGAVFNAIVVDTFKRIPCLLPPEELVVEFTELASPIFQQIDRLLLQSQKLRQARDLLLPRLMRGEIEV